MEETDILANMIFSSNHMRRTFVISSGRYNFVLKIRNVYGCQSDFY